MITSRSLSMFHKLEAENKRLRKQFKDERERHERTEKETTDVALKYTRRMHQMEFVRFPNEDLFELRVTIQPRMFMSADRREIEFIAHQMSQEVFGELVTARFMIPSSYQRMEYGGLVYKPQLQKGYP